MHINDDDRKTREGELHSMIAKIERTRAWAVALPIGFLGVLWWFLEGPNWAFGIALINLILLSAILNEIFSIRIMLLHRVIMDTREGRYG